MFADFHISITYIIYHILLILLFWQLCPVPLKKICSMIFQFGRILQFFFWWSSEYQTGSVEKFPCIIRKILCIERSTDQKDQPNNFQNIFHHQFESEHILNGISCNYTAIIDAMVCIIIQTISHVNVITKFQYKCVILMRTIQMEWSSNNNKVASRTSQYSSESFYMALFIGLQISLLG